MRGAPQSGLARLISRISRRISGATLGLPARDVPIFHFSVRDRSNITDPDRTELANLRDEFWERSEWRVEVTGRRTHPFPA